eukprot:1092791-Amphidinium_carterae.1
MEDSDVLVRRSGADAVTASHRKTQQLQSISVGPSPPDLGLRSSRIQGVSKTEERASSTRRPETCHMTKRGNCSNSDYCEPSSRNA